MRAAVLILLFTPLALGQNAATKDVEFDPSVARPAFERDAGPVVCIDAAHRNHHTATGRYAPLAELLRHDGYRVRENREPFEERSLRACELLVVSNALGERDGETAFSDEEIAALSGWVEGGGSLLLIADHPPFGAASNGLSLAFGIRMVDGHLKDSVHNEPDLPGPYFLRFDRSHGMIGDHPIGEGRSADERIAVVVTFGGQALERVEGDAVSLLPLSPSARIVADPRAASPEERSAEGMSHAYALERGRGRVVVVGEAGLFTAQVIRGDAARQLGLDELRFGMTRESTDDRQFVLNVVHWLTGVLAGDPPVTRPLTAPRSPSEERRARDLPRPSSASSDGPSSSRRSLPRDLPESNCRHRTSGSGCETRCSCRSQGRQ